MSAADCEAFVKAAVKGITDDELEKAFENYDKYRREFVRLGLTDNISQRIANAIAHDAIRNKFRRAKERQTFIQNTTVFREMNDFIARMETSGYGPGQSIRIAMEGGQSNDFGVRDSVDSGKNAYESRWIGGLLASSIDIHPAIVKLAASDPKFDSDFAHELGELRNGGTPGKSGNKIAEQFAAVARRWSEEARLTYNAKGGLKEEPDGFIDASHDPYKMVEAGKMGWVNRVFDLLDRARTFRGIDPNNKDEIIEILMRDYDRKVTGRHFGETIQAPTFKKSPSSLIDRFSLDGTFYFKDFESQKAYQQEFGHGTFVSSLIHQLTQMARATAMMDKFGPTPEIMIKQLSTHHLERLGKIMTPITDAAELAKYRKWIAELQVESMQGHIDEMTGTAAIPVNASAAKLSAGIRSVLSMSKLSNLIVSSSIGDSMNMAAQNVYGGQKGLDAFAPVLRMFEGIDPKQRKSLAYRLGEGFQGFIGSVYANAVEVGPMSGGMAKTMNNYFKWIGVTGMFDHSRQAFVRERAAWLGMNRDKAFADLDPHLQKSFLRNGIDELRWDAIRHSQTEYVNGEHYVMPEAARTADDKFIFKMIEPRLKEAWRLSKVDEAKMPETRAKRQAAFDKRRLQIIEQTRYDLEMQLRKYYSDETNYAVIQPNAKSRRISRGAIGGGRGTRPGETFGEVVRSMFMYKSFALVNWDNMARAIENRNMLKMGAAGVGMLARILAFQAVAGFFIEYMKDIGRGNWPPKAPWDPEMISRALATGGTMGLYGDYLTSIVNGYDTPLGLLGPEISHGINVLQFLGHDLPFNKKGRAGEALQLTLDTTPFGNLMPVRPILDAVIFDDLRDWSSPGYKRRKKKKLKEKGQFNIYQELVK